MDVESRILLERMNGNIELIRAGQDRQSVDIKRIEERHDQNIKRIDERLHVHSSRLQGIEAHQKFSAGERKGIELSAKAVWALGGGSIMAVLAIVARSMHL
jgi:hypothetical protein